MKLGIKTNVPIFKSVAGVKRELICLLCFASVKISVLFFGILHYVSYLDLKSIRYVCRKLILKFLDGGGVLHQVYVKLNCNIMNLYLVDNKLMRFCEHVL